jgi:hypothetical protein
MLRKKIIDENPEKALWWRLSQFKNVQRVSEQIRSVHTGVSAQNAEKQARQIRYCIEQAEEYFHSAESVSLATKPLLLYYGMASLSWALILLKKTGDYALDNLRSDHQGHGLERPKLTYSTRNLDLPGILDAIKTQVPPVLQLGGFPSELRGTFGLLFSVSRHEPVGIPRNRSQGVITERNVRLMTIGGVLTGANELAGSTLTLGRVLMDIPDMVSVFGELDLRTSFSFCSDIQIVIDADEAMRLFVVTSRNTEPEIVQLETRFRGYERCTTTRVQSGICATLTAQRGEEVRIPQVSETLDGRYFLYIPAQPEQLPEPCAFLGGMFILGMLARYYPHIWMELLERRHPLVEIVEAFLSISQRKFPNLILNNLTGDSFMFRHHADSR